MTKNSLFHNRGKGDNLGKNRFDLHKTKKHTASQETVTGDLKNKHGGLRMKKKALYGRGLEVRLVAVAGRGAADRSVGSDSARARGPGSLAGLPRFFRSVAHEGRGCNPGPRAWSARRGRAVTCARGGVDCGCTATTYRESLKLSHPQRQTHNTTTPPKLPPTHSLALSHLA